MLLRRRLRRVLLARRAMRSGLGRWGRGRGRRRLRRVGLLRRLLRGWGRRRGRGSWLGLGFGLWWGGDGCGAAA